MKTLTRTFLILALVLPALAARVPAQSGGGDQIVDSLEAYQRKVESLIADRLDALLPQRNYVMRAFVSGRKIAVPRGAAPTGTFELPGFRPSPGQAVAADEKFAIDQITVRVVLNEQLPPESLQYLRTIVPILADFRPERGDRLDLQVVPPGKKPEAEKPKPGEPGQPEAVTQPGQPPAPSQPPQLPFGPQLAEQAAKLGLTEWILIGAGAFLLLLLMMVLLILALRPRAPAAPPPLPEYQAIPPSQRAIDLAKAAEEERKAQEQVKYLENLKGSVVKTLFARADLGKDLVQAWQSQAEKLNTLIHTLGPTVARQALLPHVGVARYKDLEEAVRAEDPPGVEAQIAALREANLFLISAELEKPEHIRPDPFAFLDDLSRGQIAHLIKDEPVRVKAIVLSRAKAEDTAKILETLPKETQLEVAVTIGNLQSLPLEMLEGVALDLAEKARHVPDARTADVEGPRALVDMMGRASPSTSLYLLQSMKTKDRKLSEQVEKRFMVFDAIPLVPDEVLPQVVRTVPSAVVIQALQGAPPEIQRKVILAFPEPARPGLVNSIKAAKFDAATVDEARRQLVGRFQTLAEQGRIDLKAISSAWQAQAKAS
jgi:flagellar motor switch protein FliG